MARKRPSQLRAQAPQPPSVLIPGVPIAASFALDRLGRPEISSAQVRSALAQWTEVVLESRDLLGRPSSDWIVYVGPEARDTVDRAVAALSPPNAAALRKMVEAVDEVLLSNTVPDPRADASLPWWQRRSAD